MISSLKVGLMSGYMVTLTQILIQISLEPRWSAISWDTFSTENISMVLMDGSLLKYNNNS